MSDYQDVDLPVPKTYKLYIGGAFPRSESGRTYRVVDRHGRWLANAAQGSRKDARDAVTAARKAFPGWAGASAYNRGQVIYRIAEMLQGRRAEFVELLEATGETNAAASVTRGINLLVHYAGWTDKLAAVFGSANPVAGPYFSFTTPEPTGVVAAVAPQQSALLGLIGVLAPIITSGNTAVVIASHPHPLAAITFAEVLAHSDLPGGVVNMLSGDPAEIAPHLAAHGDVNALDLTGTSGQLLISLEKLASGTVKRVYVPAASRVDDANSRDAHAGVAAGLDETRPPGTARLRAFLEMKTVWHPTGSVSLGGNGGY